MTANHHFSKPAEYQRDDSFEQARLFSIDRRHAGLDVHPGGQSGVRTVSDDVQWDEAIEQAAVAGLDIAAPGSNVALQARGALIRSALRGDGRARFR